MIRIGTAGWHYKDWNGIVYPQPRPRGFEPLEMLSRLFDAIEINVTFYRVPDPTVTRTWVRRVASSPAFRFTAKLPRSFTHARAMRPGASEEAAVAASPTFPADPDDEERRFREALDPLLVAGRLGAVLIQFPQSFHAGPEEAARLEGILDRFSDLPLVAEFRHAGWGREESVEELRRRGVGFCNIDQPRLGSTLRPTAHVTGPIAYVRLHGRNAGEWFRFREADHQIEAVQRRYDYLYSETELAPWISTIRSIAEEGADTYVITNNHFRGKAAVNALQIKAALEGGLVDVPDPLLASYPELTSIAKPPAGRLPF